LDGGGAFLSIVLTLHDVIPRWECQGCSLVNASFSKTSTARHCTKSRPQTHSVAFSVHDATTLDSTGIYFHRPVASTLNGGLGGWMPSGSTLLPVQRASEQLYPVLPARLNQIPFSHSPHQHNLHNANVPKVVQRRKLPKHPREAWSVKLGPRSYKPPAVNGAPCSPSRDPPLATGRFASILDRFVHSWEYLMFQKQAQGSRVLRGGQHSLAGGNLNLPRDDHRGNGGIYTGQCSLFHWNRDVYACTIAEVYRCL